MRPGIASPDAAIEAIGLWFPIGLNGRLTSVDDLMDSEKDV